MSELATIGGGCFWCLEAFYQRVRGIEKVVSGYSGGQSNKPDYNHIEDHAEVVQLTFNSKTITYKEILEIFFVMHDPATLNRQGNDIGEQYRSIILFHDDEQQKVAREMKNGFAQKVWGKPAVTEIKPFTQFYPAENYHQNYYNNNSSAGYCMVVIDPKIAKLRQKFATKLKPE